jgi:hypothetical protein
MRFDPLLRRLAGEPNPTVRRSAIAMSRPRPVCGRGGCPHPAFYGQGFCFDHGVRYLRWHAERDERERADLAGTPYSSYAEIDEDPDLAEVIDLIHRFLRPGPFR